MRAERHEPQPGDLLTLYFSPEARLDGISENETQ